MIGKRVTIAEVMALYNSSIIGKIETRNWLAQEFPGFRKSRRADVDAYLEQMGLEVTDFELPDEEE